MKEYDKHFFHIWKLYDRIVWSKIVWLSTREWVSENLNHVNLTLGQQYDEIRDAKYISLYFT